MGWVVGAEDVDGSQGEAVGDDSTVGGQSDYWYRLAVIKRQQVMPSNAKGKTREQLPSKWSFPVLKTGSSVLLCPCEVVSCMEPRSVA
jgi:hypothetical protein